jgi:hypothetical protein
MGNAGQRKNKFPAHLFSEREGKFSEREGIGGSREANLEQVRFGLLGEIFSWVREIAKSRSYLWSTVAS